MAQKRITDLTAATALVGTEAIEVSQVSSTVTITAATISALAADNSLNDANNGFVAAGFAIGQRVRVTGFAGNNNLYVGTLIDVTAGKLTFGGTDGDVLVDEAAGPSVTISQIVSARTTAQEIADLAAGGGDASYPDFAGNAGKALVVNAEEDGVEWVEIEGGSGGGSYGSAYRYYGVPYLDVAYSSPVDSGYYIMRTLVAEIDGEINGVACFIRSLPTTATLTPVVYSTTATGSPSTLLAKGPTVTPVVGVNELPFDAPINVEKGQSLIVGFIEQSSGQINFAYTSDIPVLFAAKSGTTPDTGPLTFTIADRSWAALWLYGTEEAVVSGGGGGGDDWPAAWQTLTWPSATSNYNGITGWLSNESVSIPVGGMLEVEAYFKLTAGQNNGIVLTDKANGYEFVVQSDGNPLAYRLTGSGQGVIFAPSSYNSSNIYDGIAKIKLLIIRVSDTDFRIRMDYDDCPVNNTQIGKDTPSWTLGSVFFMLFGMADTSKLRVRYRLVT